MAEKKLTDEEIFKLIDEFESLSPEDRTSRMLGDKRSKTAYEIPNSNYILKEATPLSERLRNIDLKGNEAIIKQYIASKQLNKIIPDAIDQPILITRPDKKSYLLQNKLLKTDDKQLLDDYDNLISEAEKNKKLGWLDLSSGGNSGLDQNSNKIKGFDVDESFLYNNYLYPEMTEKSNILQKTRETALKNIKNSKVPRIYRSIPIIGPAIGAGLAAMSGEANAASALPILGEADNLGPEQGSEDYEIENPQRNPAARRAALEKLSR